MLSSLWVTVKHSSLTHDFWVIGVLRWGLQENSYLAMYIICASQTVSKDHDFLIKCLDDGLLYTLTLSLSISYIYDVYCKSLILISSSSSWKIRRFAKASSNVELKCQRYLVKFSRFSNMFLLHLNKRGRKNAIKLQKANEMILIIFIFHAFSQHLFNFYKFAKNLLRQKDNMLKIYG